MPYRANYPATVAEVLDDNAKFKPAALAAVRELARSKPWRGTKRERLDKLRICLVKLAAAYNLDCPKLQLGVIDCYIPAFNLIQLTKCSVVTFLHEFGHARGMDERQTCRWSINLFRRCFPRSYANCQHVRHTLMSNH